MNTKTALLQLGYYTPPKGQSIQAWTDSAMFDGIRQFQKDNGLAVDGVMRPGGPTETALNNRIHQHTPNAIDPPEEPEDPEDPWHLLPPSMCSCESADDNPYRV